MNAKSYHSDLFSLDSKTFIIISLYSVRQKAALYEFKINIHQLQFISNDLSEITILKYPLILFEYQNGFYTIEGFKMNSIHFANEPLKAKSFYYLSNIKEQNYNTLLEQRKKYKVSLAELDKMKLIQKLKISEIQQLFNDNLGNYNDNVINQFKVASIGESERLVMEKKSIYHASQSFIDDIKNMLEDKKDSVRELEKVFKLHKEKNNFRKKLTEQLKRIESILRFTNCQLINRAMMQFSYTFFNYNLNDYIKLPPFYNEVFEDSKQILRVDFYMRNEKWISLFFGVIIQMIQYLSKQFNIPLKYPVFSQGTKSAIYLSHKYDAFIINNNYIVNQFKCMALLNIQTVSLDLNISEIC